MSQDLKKKRWPTREVMSQIYDKKFWGGGTVDFYSGDGSHDASFTRPYLTAVQKLLRAFPVKPSVCDLGCGDFNIGQALVPFASTYVGIDIVPKLIARNKELFEQANLEFHCLDMVHEEWPTTDVVLLRQVMQHLSNAEIMKVVQKLKRVPYLIVTEHVPMGPYESNKDMVTSQGIRLKKKSGVDLMAPPFDLGAKNVQKIVTVPDLKNGGEILTTLYQNF